MKKLFLAALLAAVGAPAASAQTTDSPIKQRIGAYLDAFNSGDAAAVAAFWAEDAVSLNEETGERLTGRAALLEDFKAFFADNPGAKLTGQVDHVRKVTDNVAIAEGVATVYLPDADPAPSAFTAVLVKEGDQWLLESSHERDLPSPPSASAALQDLAWMVGDWRDDSDLVDGRSTVRWSANESFLIRSYRLDFADGELFEGTQVIGWDPRDKSYRTWTFNSDGSFGDGDISLNGSDVTIKLSQVTGDGGVSNSTMVLSRVDDNHFQVRKIGQTLDGAPLPASPAIDVLRVPSDAAVSQTTGEAK
ncbi:SnoaL-like domain protein [Planctomycetes bacterium MalM25]|nr:SnoaL-like domain protein [Planctomycetes bacterium MalM25]